MPNKITTQQLFDQYVAMNQKLDALDQKINGIIDGSTPANTQLTGSIVEFKGNLSSGYRRYFGREETRQDVDYVLPLPITKAPKRLVHLINRGGPLTNVAIYLYSSIDKPNFDSYFMKKEYSNIPTGSEFLIEPNDDIMTTFAAGLIFSCYAYTRVGQPDVDFDLYIVGGD